METVQKTALVFTIIGALVWLIIGIFDLNLVNYLLNSIPFLEKTIYIIVGICGLINIGLLFNHIEK